VAEYFYGNVQQWVTPVRILLINHYAGSSIHGMEYRPYYLAREWVRNGHSVTIVAASFSHVRTKNVIGRGRAYTEHIDGVHYVWLKTPSYVGNGLGRISNMLTFLGRLFIELPRLGVRPDVVIASSTYPLDIFPAHRLAQRSGARLVFEVHDLWPLTPVLLGNISKWHPYIMVMQAAEDFACRNSDFVVSLLPNADEYLQTRGMHPDKFVHIANGVAVHEWDRCDSSMPSPHAVELSKIKNKGHSIVCYAGAHGLANSLDTLIEAACLLTGLPVTFVLVGQGPEKEKLQTYTTELRLENVVFLPPVPKGSVPTLLAAMDILYIGWKKNPLYLYGISPNKLLDYMMAGKPIIHAVDAANDLVAAANCGISVPPENPQAIAEAVSRLIAMNSSDLLGMGRRGRAYVIEHHDYRKLAQRFLDAVSY
jgi:glycosyltransferase involved in cell wall biosynthesis